MIARSLPSSQLSARVRPSIPVAALACLSLMLAACTNEDSGHPVDREDTPIFVDAGREGREREVGRYPKLDEEEDRHFPGRPKGAVETLARGTFDGRPWTISVYRSQEAGWCVDYDGVEGPDDPPQGALCSSGLRQTSGRDHIGATFGRTTDETREVFVIGQLSRSVRKLKVECGDRHRDVTLLEPTTLRTPTRFYAFLALEGECTHRLGFDSSGDLIEREHLYKNLNR